MGVQEEWYGARMYAYEAKIHGIKPLFSVLVCYLAPTCSVHRHLALQACIICHHGHHAWVLLQMPMILSVNFQILLFWYQVRFMSLQEDDIYYDGRG